MDVEKVKCMVCGGNMDVGELVDESYAVSGAQRWSTSAGSILGLGLGNRVKIISLRCFDCGFLQNFAPCEERKRYDVKEETRGSEKKAEEPENKKDKWW